MEVDLESVVVEGVDPPLPVQSNQPKLVHTRHPLVAETWLLYTLVLVQDILHHYTTQARL
jgi:hypothetical protein